MTVEEILGSGAETITEETIVTGENNENPIPENTNSGDETPGKVMTAEELDAVNAYKKQLEESFRAEKEATEATYGKQLADMMKIIEDLKLSQMKEDERKRYEEQKRIEQEASEKLALAERNKALEAELEQIRTARHISDTLAKYPFIESKYRDRFLKMNREEFDRNFTEDFVQDQRELSEYRKRDNDYGNRNVFGATGGKITSVDPRALEIKQFKDDFLKGILGK